MVRRNPNRSQHLIHKCSIISTAWGPWRGKRKGAEGLPTPCTKSSLIRLQAACSQTTWEHRLTFNKWRHLTLEPWQHEHSSSSTCSLLCTYHSCYRLDHLSNSNMHVWLPTTSPRSPLVLKCCTCGNFFLAAVRIRTTRHAATTPAHAGLPSTKFTDWCSDCITCSHHACELATTILAVACTFSLLTHSPCTSSARVGSRHILCTLSLLRELALAARSSVH